MSVASHFNNMFHCFHNEFAYFVSFQGFNLFSSEAFAPAKNLMFKDSTVRLVKVPPGTDSFLYLGAEYMSVVRSLKKGTLKTNKLNRAHR